MDSLDNSNQWAMGLILINSTWTMNNCSVYTNRMLISHSIGLQRDVYFTACFITDIAARETWRSEPDGEQQDMLSPHLAVSMSSQTAICIKFPEHVFHLHAAVWK